jgi:hypothetical protein
VRLTAEAMLRAVELQRFTAAHLPTLTSKLLDLKLMQSTAADHYWARLLF